MSAEWTDERVLGAYDRWRAEQPERTGLLDADVRGYVEYHAVRYARLLEAVQELAERLPPSERLHVLDVGPNVQTALLRLTFPQAAVDTLGFAHPAVPSREHERHIQFDLNESPQPGRRPGVDREYDVIVMAEVLEHLYVPPRSVLEFLRGQVRAPGFILLQTPNAAALHKRLTLLRGRNPVEAPRVCLENPGHLHEYTIAELREQITASGLRVDWVRAENYFGTGRAARVYRAGGRLLPATWRHGVTICASAQH